MVSFFINLKQNKPIPGAEVYLIPTGNIIQTAYANAAGKYIFTNVPAGTYQLTASTNLSAGGVTYRIRTLSFYTC